MRLRRKRAAPVTGTTEAARHRNVTQDIADVRGALGFAQDLGRRHGDDCRLAFRKADRALDRIATKLFAKGR
jgi:hypothetical protein